MLSESARRSSAAEARFRLQVAEATARTVSVVGLDPESDDIVARLAARSWNGVSFFATSHLTPRATDWVQAVAAADLVVMVASAGAAAPSAALIGEACSRTRASTATLIVRSASATDEALSNTLADVRPWSLMVVIASDDDCVENLLRSFR